MQIQAQQIGKKYKHQWVIKDFSYTFSEGRKYAITGRNGSGKSTLLKLLSGLIPLDSGNITYQVNGNRVLLENWHECLSWVGPYTEVLEEFTAKENFYFCQQFINFSLEEKSFFEKLALPSIRNKALKDFSSGMKQKFKLALSMFSTKPVLLLDEPTSNLDHDNIEWYLEQVKTHSENKIVIIASNQPYEYEMCNEVISISSVTT